MANSSTQAFVRHVTAPKIIVFADSPFTIGNATAMAAAGATPIRTFVADTAGGAVTIKLPAKPVANETVQVKRKTADGNQLTVGRNGKKIDGVAADFLDANAAKSTWRFQYDGIDTWWVL